MNLGALLTVQVSYAVGTGGAAPPLPHTPPGGAAIPVYPFLAWLLAPRFSRTENDHPWRQSALVH
jgi:hypothetical protein